MSEIKDTQVQAENEALKSENEALKSENVTLNVKVAEQGEVIEDFYAQTATLEEENLKLKAEIAKSGASTKQVVEEKVPKAISIGGKKYKFAFRSCHVPGHGKMSAAEISQDKEAQKAILAIKGQTILKEIK